ncbi:hypothetical protein HDV62DRAFT_120187 [Trichoderma sp. SZMC 28011]
MRAMGEGGVYAPYSYSICPHMWVPCACVWVICACELSDSFLRSRECRSEAVCRFWNAAPGSDVFASNAAALRFATTAMPIDFCSTIFWSLLSRPNVSSRNPTRGLAAASRKTGLSCMPPAHPLPLHKTLPA